MSRRSKREMVPSPQPFPSSSLSVHGLPPTPPGSSTPGCFPAPPASMKTTPGSAAPVPWWCGPPVPQQAMPWWPAPSCGGGAAASSSQPVQKDDIDSDPNEWQVQYLLQRTSLHIFYIKYISGKLGDPLVICIRGGKIVLQLGRGNLPAATTASQ
jgi:hypothetical protein